MKGLFCLFIFCAQIFLAQTPTSKTYQEAYADSVLDKANAIYYANPDSSLYYTNVALAYAIKNKLDVYKAKALKFQARNEVLKGNVESALKKLKEAIVIFEKHNEQEQIAKSYGLMSTAFSKVKNHQEEIKLLNKSIEIYEKLDNVDGLKSALINLANSYQNVKEYGKALEALHESKPYIESASFEWFYYYINAGIIYKDLKKYELAKIQFDSCLAISHRNKMVDAEITAFTDMADLLQETNQSKKAIDYYNQAIQMARKSKLPVEESDALQGIIHAYASTGEFKNAFYSQNRLKTISDSLFNIEKIKNINDIEGRLKVSEKEKTIAIQKLSIEKNALEQAKSKSKIQYLITGSLLLLIILFFTYYTYLKVKRQKSKVEVQKRRAEKLNQLNQKIFAVIAHDFKSPLITLNMLIDLMDKENISKEDLSAYSADVRNQIIQSGQILENLLNWAKSELNITKNSNQNSTPHLIAKEIIKEMDYMALRKNVTIENKIDHHLLIKLPSDILKIIIRNLTSNAVKFSHSGANVTLGSDKQGVIYIKDNGVGIDEKVTNQLFNGTIKSKLGTFNETGFGLGLYITYELIHKFGGKLWVEKNQPMGTVFKFAV